jgi:FAD:protein FMN transferase
MALSTTAVCADRRASVRRSAAVMGTVVTVEVVHGSDQAAATAGADAAIVRALAWFADVESTCTRFDPHSELMALSHRVGEPVPASPVLLEAVRFALAVAEASGGAFDPTVGHAMLAHGFNREHRTGARVPMPEAPRTGATFRDVTVDDASATITVRRPLGLDLGAVAKGLAVDLAARELLPFRDFAIDAGGDVYVGGSHADGGPWEIGIRHPRRDGELVDRVRVSDVAVCTSGDYERRTTDGDGHHILDPRTGRPCTEVASVTVIAKTAMVADALATAAFVLGPRDGIAWLERQGVEGVMLTPSLERHATRGFRGEAPR